MSSLLLFRKRNVPVRNPCFLANPFPDPPKRKVNAGRVSLPSIPNCQRTEHRSVHHPTETRRRTLIRPPKPPCREVSGTASPPPATLPPSMNTLIRSSPAPVNNLLSDFFAAADYFCGPHVDKLAYRPAKAAEISHETGKNVYQQALAAPRKILRRRTQARVDSRNRAVPSPPAAAIAANPMLLRGPLARIWASLTANMAPDAPTGCPRASAPPP